MDRVRLALAGESSNTDGVVAALTGLIDAKP
jgi:hypothetical protein